MIRRLAIFLMLTVLWCPEAIAKPSAVRVASARQLGAATIDCGGRRTATGWEARLCVSTQFRDGSFNEPLYLDGLILKAEATGAEVTIEKRRALGVARWLVVARYDERPAQPVARLLIAGRTFTANLVRLPWKTAGGGQRADGYVELEIPRPNWAVLRSLRFLAVDRPGSSLLEVVVENHASRPLAVRYVSLRANRDRFSCATGSEAAPVQIIKVHWPAVRGRRRPSDPSGATTTLHDQTVEIETSYQAETCSNDEEFALRIPVANVVKPGEVVRLLYRFDESWGDVDANGTPKRLSTWDTVTINVEADGRLFPADRLLTGRRGSR